MLRISAVTIAVAEFLNYGVVIANIDGAASIALGAARLVGLALAVVLLTLDFHMLRPTPDANTTERE
ncbi:MAG: hypothetical protein NXI24_22200 [bacterium]|nr:hypothetical protein [bacterium]